MESAVILVDKPSGPTSHDIVYWARKITGIKGIGHTGTLDPIASGLMLLICGEATKLSNYLMDGDKEYIAHIKLGAISTTYDREGVISPSEKEIPSLGEIQNTISVMVGELNIAVPAYSAVKVDGKSLMERARKNEETPVIIRTMNFFEADILKFENPLLEVRIRCGKGAYIRSWAQELGVRLGCGAYIQELRRTHNSGFDVRDAIILTKETTAEQLKTCSSWVPLEKSLLRWPRIELNSEQEKRVRNGLIPHDLSFAVSQALLNSPSGHGFLKSQDSSKLTAIVGLNSSQKPMLNRIFTY